MFHLLANSLFGMAQAVSRQPVAGAAGVECVVDSTALGKTFRCQRHYISAPYSFIHLSPTPCNLSN